MSHELHIFCILEMFLWIEVAVFIIIIIIIMNHKVRFINVIFLVKNIWNETWASTNVIR